MEKKIACKCLVCAALNKSKGFLGGAVVKNLPPMQETRVQSLDGEDPLEDEMATHSSILTWKIAWTEEPGGLRSIRSQRDTTDQLSTHEHKQK